jgi:hypothetical protein
MKRKIVRIAAVIALALVQGAVRHAQAQGAKNTYPASMQYLMDRDAEIALARSASHHVH